MRACLGAAVARGTGECAYKNAACFGEDASTVGDSVLPMHFLALIALVPLVFALPPTKRAVAYYDPTANGGAMLTDASGGSSASDLGEPLNVIISGLSSSAVLGDSGFLNFAQSIGFSTECLGIHIGTPQTANLGDGNGYVPQSAELREDYGDPDLGTCLESLIGGNHLRMYRQNGTQANSGALFLAVSQEEDASDNHNIIANGYNVGKSPEFSQPSKNANLTRSRRARCGCCRDYLHERCHILDHVEKYHWPPCTWRHRHQPRHLTRRYYKI
ncbi:PPM-type phosphatase domain-containing protein [Mycena chlorophos]|uniref:PPM-type phosphatase domain-containing protein n=1 Tax=Mycena chlorophos TaxID=658473 RepID=A0A8H6W3R3_MYCCL|nr:PPM-type phosphatase domain-containing protein [Mycena chlorophos]